MAPDAAVLPGIDGEKMSKSYRNGLDPFLDDAPLLQADPPSIKTDSKGVDDPKDPEENSIFQIYRAAPGET